MNAAREGWLPAPLPAALALPMQELLARLIGQTRERAIKQLMLVGAAGGVGTSFIAGHWATLLAQPFGNVLLIEVRPEVSDEVAATESPAALAARGPVVAITMPEHSCLGLVSSGGALPPEWLESFGLILWDVPPLSGSTVAMVLAPSVDGIVLLAQAYKTRREVALHSARRLQDSGGRLLGVVLNRTLNFIPGWLYRLL